MVEITHINPTTIKNLRRKRVAVYARVSSDKDAAENSLQSQMDYFKRKIATNPGWIYAGIYADDGISGTVESRPAFQKMMEDARAGKIDYIITKSITRFARNTVVLLQSIRELKSLGINVEFENDHLNTISKSGELLITLLAMHAEEQSRSASDNKRWQIKRYFEEGTPTYFRIYGYRMVDNHLEVVHEEAEIVVRIYQLYLSGLGRYAIAKILNEEGITIWGNRWTHNTLFKILRNEKYKGDMLLQKSYRENYRTKKKIINRGEKTQYYVSGSHEPIISPELYDAVQQEIARREKQYCNGTEPKDTSLFQGLILCGNCKTHFMRKMSPSSTGKFPVWRCQTLIHRGANVCNAKQIRESILIEKTREVLNLPDSTELTRELIVNNFTAIESVADYQLRFFHIDGRITTVKWQNQSRKDAWTPEMREAARIKALSKISQKEAN